MMVAISRFAGYNGALDWRAVAMVAHTNTNQRIDVIGTLCEQLLRDYPELANYKQVVSKLRSAQKARNRFMHLPVVWNEEAERVEAASASARGSLKTNIVEVKLSEIEDAVEKVHEANCALTSLVTREEIRPIWEREA